MNESQFRQVEKLRRDYERRRLRLAADIKRHEATLAALDLEEYEAVETIYDQIDNANEAQEV